ncbi:translation initiation factor IF-2 [Acetobacterium bakii]|uniref:Translation initiation factor IF-2 n=1 Tax=Acetobacterium bakii TaxID=52689 RepID=A0A0L6TZF6_9FIRM|nr:translation initiation factor IF-2 [Acetobacterium bakii]KNZ41654.1 translation initiation factor IF-2 [Acetobacterium bakii]
MSKLRVYDFAKKYNIPSKEFVVILNQHNIPVKNHMSALTEQQISEFEQKFDKEKYFRELEKKKSETPHEQSTQNKPQNAAAQKKQGSETSGAKDPVKSKGNTASGAKKRPVSSNQATQQKPRDHSKKEKTARSVYKRIKDEKKKSVLENQIYEIPEILTVGELADILEINVTEIIKTLMMAGSMVSINQEIDFDTASIVASEFGFEVVAIKIEDVVSKILEEYDEEESENETIRPAVVTVMGHVDHGKTSLLDRIRKTNVMSSEAGGITQHIGAYTVNVKNQSVTFIDTPGHEAFTAMRSRGAQITDIAVLVVAADDGVMPQTVEAINHAKAAGVPILVAINKIDKPGADPERVKQELTKYNLVVEEWGGETIAVPVSAKTGEGIDNLLEMIVMMSEMEELRADASREARGSVIEAQVKRGKGPVATLLIQQGTLHIGDSIISGTTYGKVRTMIDDKGKRLKKAGPSTPVEVSGLSDILVAGDDFIVLENEKEARQLAEKRKELQKGERVRRTNISLDDLFSQIQDGNIQDINIIIKADVQGSIEAIIQSLEKLDIDTVRINVIHGAVGAINETDVLFAATSNAIIIGFNVRPDKNAIKLADTEKVDIRLYRVIYDAIDDIKKAMEGMLAPEYREKVLGNAEIREVFKIPSIGTIAGCYVTEGKINRNDDIRIIRDGIVVMEGKIASLKRFKDDVKEVNAGYEFGIGIEKYNDLKNGDIIEAYTMEAIER